MENFTYEKETKKEIYETYEWDNTWIDHANDREAKRVLYIGDSISCGTRQIATEKSEGKILFDGFGTSKGLDNPFFKDALKTFANQQCRRDAVLFNNGLHGWHLEDEKEYKFYFEDMIKFLLEEYKNVPLFVVLTTHVRDEEREKRVIVRNNAAKEIAEKYNLKTIDLYEVSSSKDDLLSPDGVHLTKEGYELLALRILKDMEL